MTFTSMTIAGLGPSALLNLTRYAIRNEIPFVKALKSVPQEMRDRMSPQHTRDLGIRASAGFGSMSNSQLIER